MTTKEVTNATKRDLAKPIDAAWGEAPTLSAQDILIPKILAMQGLSDFVTDGEAKFGEFRDSVTKELLGSIDKPVEVIPFKMEKVWIEYTKKGDKFEFAGVVPITPANEGLELEFTKDGKECRRDRCMNFYVLLASETEKAGALPKIVSFRRTSSRAGKQLATMMYVTNRNAGLSPAGKVVALGGSKESNDKGTYVILNITEKEETTEAQVAVALKWLTTLRGSAHKVDNADLGSTEKTTATEKQHGEGAF